LAVDLSHLNDRGGLDMILQPVYKPLAGLSRQKARKIFDISRLCVIAILIGLGTFGPATALGGHSRTRSFATVAVFSHATPPSRPPISSRRTDPPDARPDPSAEDRFVDQLYEKLMRESARVLNRHE
jgi:hypothetical protein